MNSRAMKNIRPLLQDKRTLQRQCVCKTANSRASSLVVTLLVIVVLSTIVVAFMQSMSIERSVSKSFLNRERAQQAAEAGLAMATRILAIGTTNTPGYAVITTNVGVGFQPVLLIADRESTSPTNLIPLISGPLNTFLQTRSSDANALGTFLAPSTNTNTSISINLNRKRGNYKIISNENSGELFNAAWVFLTNSTGETNARFAYYVIDEESRLNLNVHGRSSNTNRSGWESDVGKVPVSIPENPKTMNSASATALLSSTETNLAAVNLGQLFTDRANFEERKHLYTLSTAKSEDFIPTGYIAINNSFSNYSDAGKPKYNINDLSTNSIYGTTAFERATNIATIIDRNLPNLKLRDVAFTADGKPAIRYVERITASIVDYIDTDTTSTLLSDGEPAGKELAPVITSIAEKYNWISESGSGTSWTNRIKHTVYVQVWNPYQTNVAGTLEFHLKTFRPIEIPGAILTPMADVDGTNTVSLNSNQYKVYELGSTTNTVTSIGPQANLTQTNYPRLSQSSSTSVTLPKPTRYKASWDGVPFDYTANNSLYFDPNGPGLEKSAVGGSSTSISLNGTSRFSINYPQYGYNDAVKGFRAVADPRQNYLANYVWKTLAQSNPDVRWNGRNNNMSGPTRQDYLTVWAERDAPRTDPRLGTFVGDADPTTAPEVWVPSDANDAFAFIRNGTMKGIGELGNIYDPAQLSDAGFATFAGDPDSWYASGGGRTLRIGYPEYDYPNSASPSGSERKAPSWNIPGTRSVHLLDLFTVDGTDTNGVGSRLGKININTAHHDVLMALFYHLSQNADAKYTNSILTPNAASDLASIAISNRPYWKKSDIYKFAGNILNATNFNPVLGTSATNLAAIMDPGREQILSSVLDLIDTQSRAFRIIIVGQALSPLQKVESEAILESIVEIETTKTGTNYYAFPIEKSSFFK